MTEKQIALFWSKVIKTETCWLWTGITDTRGYGRFWVGNQLKYAHRLTIVIAGVQIPEGYFGLHKCNVTNCVKYDPKHVYVGTLKENSRDILDSAFITRSPRSFGQLQHSCKLREQDVLEIIKLRNEGVTGAALSRQYGVTQMLISKIVHKKVWRYLHR